ncbi:SDR family oxidoreductase [Sphaerimonospora thailandensis]|uniref:3-alpha-(Or 20-beta)-hydroxysteroid dehydrogenase n=1 Tax=Sphaerimonospora thailandensis TaxID=795644 RepID=A0A8J3VWQ5_9ACTN|nr:SDR family oxidoreductase [Sphaerimonospora thailandensis]GIH68074.1 3-alpha-(or 20-beta)-hydroxysteroid dehydrogenase [Sphaerimonospora thailandensis]
MGRLDGKVALITGGARGMGASHVRAFVAEGAKVVFGDILEDEGRALEKELGDGCRFVPHDATSVEGWEAVVGVATTTFGGLHVLVNNAGILGFGSLEEMTVEDYRRILDVNLVSQWLGLKYGSAAMSEGGSIVNISSVNGIVGGDRLTGYSSSKFGVTGLTKSAAIELAPKKIRVNSVHPGGVATPMLGMGEGDVQDVTAGPMARIPIPRFARASEVSNLVLFLACDESSYCTGAEFLIDGGMTAGAGF